MAIISQIIVYIMVAFMVVGAIDRSIGNKFGLGEEWDNGFAAMGPLATGMGGIMVTADWIGKVLTPTVGKAFEVFGGDPCMAGALVLSIDTGGYPLAHALQPNFPDIANYSAVMVASMMGPTIAFAIPVCLGMMEEKDKKYLPYGILPGIVMIPFACLLGGLLAGFEVGMLIKNTIPVLIFAIIIAVGLKFATNVMIKIFNGFSVFMTAYLSLFMALAIVQELTPIHVIDLLPLSDVWLVCGAIGMVLAGAFPMVKVITKVAAKPFAKLGSKLGINEVAVAGLLACTANSVPCYAMIKDMDPKGKILNIAFSCCAAFGIGDHLGFCAGVEPDLVFPMVAAKLLGGVLCILAAMVFLKMDSSILTEE